MKNLFILTGEERQALAEILVEGGAPTCAVATDILLAWFDDIPGLELVSDEQKMVWIEEIWKLAVELRTGEEGRSRYPNSNGDRSDDQDL